MTSGCGRNLDIFFLRNRNLDIADPIVSGLTPSFSFFSVLEVIPHNPTVIL
jgi:hypothetical protein